MLAASFPLSALEMASAVQPQVVSMQMDRLPPERDEAADVSVHATQMVARLRISADSEKDLLINPRHAAIASAEDSSKARDEDGAAFIIAPNAHQRSDGLAAAIIGDPGFVSDSDTGEMTLLDANALLDLYDTLGKDCIGKLRGSWAILIVDPSRSRILFAIDRMGRQPLYYRINNDFVLIGSSLDSLQEYSGNAGLDSQALYEYLYFHMVPAPAAVMDRFHKLGSAFVMDLTPAGQHLDRYWTPVFHESTTEPLANAHVQLKARLKTAVKRCALGCERGHDDDKSNTEKDSANTESTHKKVGAFLSGGLDSSTVAGMLSEIQGGSCDAYSIGFDAEGYDEMAYARIAARHFGIRLHEHYVTPNEVVEALPKVAAAFDEPFGNSSALPAYFCARMAAEDGIDLLLAGDGGDELFAGNTRYAGQEVFEDYRQIPRWLRSLIIEPLVKTLPARLPLISKGRSFIWQANTDLPERLQYYSFLEQNSPHKVFMPEFLKWVDKSQPLKLLNGIFQHPPEASSLNRMLFLDWQITLADNDLRKVTQACELGGVKVGYPMLDDDLVEFSTSIPSAWKLPGNKSKDNRLRHFYKQALSVWLPDATISKSKHGFGLPFGLWMKTHKPLQEMACDNIIKLKARGIFLPSFLDQAIDSHRGGNAAYFGELIWVLMSLELWLAANQPDYYFDSDL